MYKAMGIARDSIGHTSAIVATPVLKPGLANRPAPSRQTIREPIFLDEPAPAMKAAKRGMLHR